MKKALCVRHRGRRFGFYNGRDSSVLKLAGMVPPESAPSSTASKILTPSPGANGKLDVRAKPQLDPVYQGPASATDLRAVSVLKALPATAMSNSTFPTSSSAYSRAEPSVLLARVLSAPPR